MKRIILFIIGITFMLSIVGCQNKKSENEVNFTPSTFEKDSSTIKNSESWQFNRQPIINNNTDDNEVVDPSINVGEIKIENTDGSKLFNIIEDRDIEYNGVVFKNLYSNIQHLELPCDQNTFINFVIKTYVTNSKHVNTEYLNDNEYMYNPEIDGDDNVYISIDEGLQESEYYNSLVKQYNDKAIWSLTLYEDDYSGLGIIYGCKSFILYSGGDTEQVVDMSEYNYTGEEINIDSEDAMEEEGITE